MVKLLFCILPSSYLTIPPASISSFHTRFTLQISAPLILFLFSVCSSLPSPVITPSALVSCRLVGWEIACGKDLIVDIWGLFFFDHLTALIRQTVSAHSATKDTKLMATHTHTVHIDHTHAVYAPTRARTYPQAFLTDGSHRAAFLICQ